jgi:ribA/ribD-fused uncharacterized protein
MAPLWLKYPNIPDGSIGWRMGYGESYAMEFYQWFQGLSKEEKEEYNRKFPKPISWSSSEDMILSHEDFWTYKWQKDEKMVYSVDSLLAEKNAGVEKNALYFWGHHPNKTGDIGRECFSQWYMAKFHVGHIGYCCMEQYMMSKKALLFGDTETNEKIMEAKEQNLIKQLGRKVRGFDEETWNRFKVPIVLNGNYYKFSQLDNLRRYLLSTGDSILVEASPYDTIWGIGMQVEEALTSGIDQWRGTNLLGFALMEVRDEIERLWKYEKEIDVKE